MTTDLEEEFFKAFEIKKKYFCSYHDCNCPIEDIGKFNKKCPKQEVTPECDARSRNPIYPLFTDEHYLKLIALHNIYIETRLYSLDYKCLKEEVLQDLIDEQELRKLRQECIPDSLKCDVQKIFEI